MQPGTVTKRWPGTKTAFRIASTTVERGLESREIWHRTRNTMTWVWSRTEKSEQEDKHCNDPGQECRELTSYELLA